MSTKIKGNIQQGKATFAKNCKALVDSGLFNTLTTILTLYALFGFDIRDYYFTRATDSIFDAITVFSVIMFTVEIIAASIGKEDYFGSFFMGVDVVATFSLIFDIYYIAE